MSSGRLLRYFCAGVISSMLAIAGFGQDSAGKQAKPTNTGTTNEKPSTRSLGRNHVFYVDPMAVRGLKKPAGAVASQTPSTGSFAAGAGTTSGTLTTATQAETSDDSAGNLLPLWTFQVRFSSRDGNPYPGTMVGRNPFVNPGTTNVPTVVIPLLIKTKTVGTKVDPMTGAITTQPGDTIFDPSAADNVCLSAPNNVPVTLVKQSPMFTPTAFTFGGTYVGTTEYNDAFQRANFWNALGEDRDEYHVLLQPVEFLPAIELDAPDVYGLALTDGTVLEPVLGTTSPFCAPLGILDINWFDTHLTGKLIPELREKGVLNPGTFPIFLVYNVVWASPVNNFFFCCALGYHATTGFPIPTQTYSPAEFDSTGFLFGLPAFSDSAILSHEVDEWMNDPMISNPTPPWGHTGQVGFCQANLEVGDPLTGTAMPPVTMPNGFTYHLQELAFFSWFFGAPSVAVNGWYSDNNTFRTDAGAPCH